MNAMINNLWTVFGSHTCACVRSGGIVIGFRAVSSAWCGAWAVDWWVGGSACSSQGGAGVGCQWCLLEHEECRVCPNPSSASHAGVRSSGWTAMQWNQCCKCIAVVLTTVYEARCWIHSHITYLSINSHTFLVNPLLHPMPFPHCTFCRDVTV